MGLMFKYAAYFNSLIALLLGFFVYLNGPLKKQNILLFLLSASIALYAIFFALSIYARNPALSLLEVRIFHLFAAFIATFFYLFANEIIFGNTFKRPLHFLPFLTGILTAYFLLKGDVVRGVERIGNLPNWTVPGSQFFIYLSHYGFFTTLPIVLLIIYYFRTSGVQKNQIKLVLIGAGLALLGGWTTFLPGWGIKVEPYGIHFIFIFQFLLAYAILKYQLMDIRTTLSKIGAVAATLFIYGLGYLSLIYFYPILFKEEIRAYFFAFFSLTYGLLAGLLFSRLSLRLQTAAERTFIRGWYDFDKVISEISEKLIPVYTLKDALREIKTKFQEIEFEGVRIFLAERGKERFSLFETEAGQSEEVPFSHPLIQYCLKKQEAFSFLSLDSETRNSLSDFRFLKANYYLPLYSSDALEAIIALQGKTSEAAFDSKDIALFKLLQNQALLVLDRIRPYERIKNNFEATQKKLYDAEIELERSQRLASLGRIIQEVGHEIRNPLAALFSRAQDLRTNAGNQQFIEESAELIVKKCNQIEKIVNMMYSTSHEPKFEPQAFDIRESIEGALRFLPAREEIKIIKEFQPAPAVWGDKDELERVFTSLFTNAFDAMSEKGGALTIRINGDGEKRVKIEVADTGVGIEKNNLPKIFDYFYTTKFGKINERIGFGLPVVHKIIVEHHKGSLNVESSPGKGTRFVISLPTVNW